MSAKASKSAKPSILGATAALLLGACASTAPAPGDDVAPPGPKADDPDPEAPATCLFPETSRALLRSLDFAVGAEEALGAADPLDPVTEAQILATFAASAEAATAQEAIGSTDDAEIYRRELRHLITGESFTFLYAWGGENQFGWIFRAGTPEVVAYDGDESIYECTVPAVPGAVFGGLCLADGDCAEGSRCHGRVADRYDAYGHAWGLEHGLCGAAEDPLGSGEACEADLDCAVGLFCGGPDTGCLPAWMRHEIVSEEGLEIAPESAGESWRTIRGLATVILDATLDLDLVSRNVSAVTITLLSPCGEEVPVFDGNARDGIEVSEWGLSIRGLDVTSCTDHTANGRYTVRVANASSEPATLEGWSVTASSRWD